MRKINKFIYVLLTIFFITASSPNAVFAWNVLRTARVECTSQNTAVVKTSFTNNEPKAMNVIIKNPYAETDINLGTIASGETKTAEIDTKRESITAGLIIFHLTWADGKRGSDKRSAKQIPISCLNTVLTPTKTATSSSTTKPAPTPTNAPSKTTVIDKTVFTQAKPTPTAAPKVSAAVTVKELPKTGINPASLIGLLSLFPLGIFLRSKAK